MPSGYGLLRFALGSALRQSLPHAKAHICTLFAKAYNQSMSKQEPEFIEIGCAGNCDVIAYQVDGVLHIETEYDYQVKVGDEWFYVDELGQLTHRVTVH